jgi:glycosyltransferase involved in cell wall biosynthesis
LKRATQRGARIYLDLSRLLSAGRRRTPSGIERVELAYAKHFGRADGTRFVAYFLGRLHVLPARFASAYVETIERAWRYSGSTRRAKATTFMVCMYVLLLAISLCALLLRQRTRSDAAAVYISLSHENLTAREAITYFKTRTGAKLLFFVHDLIPVTHPEYVRPGQSRLHRRRMDNVGALADAVLVNSAATRDAFLAHLNGKRVPKIRIVHLGVASNARAKAQQSSGSSSGSPYFLCLATIEPRKNHLLLLNLWRNLLTESATVPRLIIVGRRGWENEMVLDMLERCAAIAGTVEERRNVRDDELASLLRGARALLLPSFVEGYGLPVAEALDAGTPVVCSDLPALREIGGNVPEYLDPLDGPGWRKAVLDYSEPASPRRAAQCQRMLAWQAPLWDSHFEQVSRIVEDLMGASDRDGEQFSR